MSTRFGLDIFLGRSLSWLVMRSWTHGDVLLVVNMATNTGAQYSDVDRGRRWLQCSLERRNSSSGSSPSSDFDDSDDHGDDHDGASEDDPS